MRYLSDEVKKGFEKYKYNSRDTSPLANYIMHPFWNWLVEYFPRWLAPNLMTLAGFLCCIAIFLIFSYYDHSFTAVSSDLPGDPVPNWVWLLCAVLNFLSHTLDGVDGKQARRTGSSSPIGEMFDHGCDSLATCFFTISMYSLFGRGQYGADPMDVFFLYWSVMACFLLAHWEKYNTDILYLPWGYDLSQVGITLMYLFTFFVTSNFWQTNVPYLGISYATTVLILVQGIFWFMSLPNTLWNVFWSYVNGTGRQLSLPESLRPLISFALLIMTSTVWIKWSPSNVINLQPRLFMLAVGTTFSNIACRLIVSQMSRTRADLFNPIGLVYLGMVSAILLAPDVLAPYEVYCLVGYTTLAIVLHVCYAFIVVNEMLDHFNLRAFIIKPPGLSAENGATKVQ